MDYRRVRTLRPRGRAMFATAVAIGAIALCARPAAGQEGDLSSLLPDLILRDVVLPTPTSPGLSHSAHFSPLVTNDVQNPAVGIVESVNKLIAAQLSAFPLGSSSGGFTYTFDRDLGTFRRGSPSFGPSFAERATTLGRRRFNSGFNYQHVSYSSIEGSSLGDGSIKVYLHHRDCCSVGSGTPTPPFFGVVQEPDGTNLSPFFEGDVIEAALSMRIKTDTVAMFGNYGLTNRWDIGVAVPIAHVSMDASVLATITRLSTESNPAIHTFEAGNPAATQKTFARSGSASGIGDVLVRSKYRLLDLAGGGVAIAADLRLPTGDEKNLLGGNTQGRVTLVVSSGRDRLAEHVNVGYALSRKSPTTIPGTAIITTGEFPDEIGYAAGAEFAAHARLTVVGDFVGRTLRDAGRLDLVTKSFAFERPGPEVIPPPTRQFQEFQPRAGNINLLFGTVGAKYNPVGNLLVTGSILVPLTSAGLKNRVSPVIGIDFAF